MQLSAKFSVRIQLQDTTEKMENTDSKSQGWQNTYLYMPLKRLFEPPTWLNTNSHQHTGVWRLIAVLLSLYISILSRLFCLGRSFFPVFVLSASGCLFCSLSNPFRLGGSWDAWRRRLGVSMLWQSFGLTGLDWRYFLNVNSIKRGILLTLNKRAVMQAH